jgi:2-amino-4-hydroxy-6-hydroxymethyldihydropteridine diphosphokinase
MNNVAYLSLGSNVGDRLGYLKEAIELLDSHEGITIIGQSSIYETDPVGYTEQGNFLNLVVKIKTDLSAENLLYRCLQNEIDMGRKREFKWGPRIIDLDILLYNHENIESEKLILPHPRMHERAFVLVPLLEVSKDLMHPVFQTPFKEFLENTPDKEGVRLWKQINGEDAYAHLGN